MDDGEVTRPKVLVVDDDRQVAWVVTFGLECEGYETLTAGSGAEALELIEAHHPELMILDVMMPVMDGWTVLERLGARPPAERPRVVMVTALASAEDRAKAEALGVAAYVTKPFDVGELLRLLDGLAARVA